MVEYCIRQWIPYAELRQEPMDMTTVDGQIRYLKAARATEYVTCTAKVVKPGRNLTVVAFEITDANGMLLNTGDFTFYNLKEKEIL